MLKRHKSRRLQVFEQLFWNTAKILSHFLICCFKISSLDLTFLRYGCEYAFHAFGEEITTFRVRLLEFSKSKKILGIYPLATFIFILSFNFQTRGDTETWLCNSRNDAGRLYCYTAATRKHGFITARTFARDHISN